VAAKDIVLLVGDIHIQLRGDFQQCRAKHGGIARRAAHGKLNTGLAVGVDAIEGNAPGQPGYLVNIEAVTGGDSGNPGDVPGRNTARQQGDKMARLALLGDPVIITLF